VALITGVNGQDGSYLAEILAEKGYEVHGTIRPASYDGGNANVKHLLEGNKLTLHLVDVLDKGAVLSVLLKVTPDELYNFAAQPTVPV